MESTVVERSTHTNARTVFVYAQGGAVTPRSAKPYLSKHQNTENERNGLIRHG